VRQGFDECVSSSAPALGQTVVGSGSLRKGHLLGYKVSTYGQLLVQHFPSIMPEEVSSLLL
jgi:hypothetical protein